MTEPNRPHCRAPKACRSTTEKHCRACASARVLQMLWDDPDYRQRQSDRMARRNRDPKVNALQVAGWKKNKAGVAKVKRVARAAMQKLRADPDVAARRNVAIIAAIPKRKADRAAAFAARLSIPVSLIPEFRAIRYSSVPNDEIVSALRASYPEAFAAMEAAAGATTVRDLGPIPAIGMPGRAEWTRRANAIQAGARG